MVSVLWLKSVSRWASQATLCCFLSSRMHEWDGHAQPLAGSPHWKQTLPPATGWLVIQAVLIIAHHVPCPVGVTNRHVTQSSQSEPSSPSQTGTGEEELCPPPAVWPGASGGREAERMKPAFVRAQLAKPEPL